MMNSGLSAPSGYALAIDRLFRAQSRATLTSAVYFIAGTAVTATAMVGWSMGEAFTQATGVAAPALISTAALWWAVGGMVMHQQSRRMEALTEDYQRYVQARDAYSRPTPGTMGQQPSDAPWELRAFAAPHANWPFAPRTAPSRPTAPSHVQPRFSAERQYLRPISLFGAFANEVAR